MERPARCWWGLAALLATACTDGGTQLSEAGMRGQGVYQNVCIACHNANPNEDGTLGPAIAGASLELLRARVLEGEYPEGYTPKRNTQAMPVFPYLEDDLPDLAVYLSEVSAASQASEAQEPAGG